MENYKKHNFLFINIIHDFLFGIYFEREIIIPTIKISIFLSLNEFRKETFDP
ncbi:hypothetical protein SAMN03080598_03971 [Algoriphagus boritolerans DSM 17298 = JCM 18970]|uniref:Uncharacterized protein n=1 Tax=Algoriphagus boritolerans DSM 17298 = JCM 18970 TaxID=1120964 RepID=A0A1H6A962_9BACT|nr:hypothetical protein SAMN03080598_03971 [Algoriphagus boritolerans DSM 17298 = JCM 18970]